MMLKKRKVCPHCGEHVGTISYVASGEDIRNAANELQKIWPDANIWATDADTVDYDDFWIIIYDVEHNEENQIAMHQKMADLDIPMGFGSYVMTVNHGGNQGRSTYREAKAQSKKRKEESDLKSARRNLMTNDKYAEAVAEIMGWTIHYDTRMGDAWYSPENMYLVDVDKFNPATDWASAGVWIEWLADRCFAITFSKSKIAISTISTIEKTHCGFANTPLEAFKNASEKFIEARNE